MYFLITFNIFVLAGLLLLFFREEMRFRRFSKTMSETKADLTTIVHQLRSPLGNLRKFMDFLQRKEFGNLSLAQQEAISNAQSSLGESLLLLDRLLARSRLEEARVAAQKTSSNLREIVQGVVDAVAPIAQKKHHTITVAGKKTVSIFTDALLLHGILDEILSNALYYTPDDGKIHVSIIEKDKRVIVEIADTGIGISPEERPYLFEKFFRGERAKPMHPGNGLGLAFAKQFTTKLGGTIQCVSLQRKGSRFVVSLPQKALYRLN